MGIKFKMSAAAMLAALLVGCGGGGGGGSDGGFQPPSLIVTMTTGQTQTTPRSLVDVMVSARNSNGAPLPNGSTLTVQVSPPSVGVVSFISDGGTTGSQGGPIVIGDRVNATVVGGTANLRFHSRSVGTAVLTVSMNDPNAPARVVTATANISVVAGPASDPRLRIVATTATLPANTFNVGPFLGSPYLSEATVTWRRLNGELVTVFPQGRDNNVNVSVSPVLNTGGFCLPDDPATTDINEFLLRLAQAPVPTVAGKATIFFRSLDIPTTSVMTVTAQDPDTDETVEASFTFNVVNGSPRLPATLVPSRTGRALYIQGSGGNTAEQVTVEVLDGASGPVPDPISGSFAYNNVRAELVGGSLGGDRLRAANAQGGTESGPDIRFRSINGISAFTYESGNQTRLAQIRISADRADNNVDNGISDPVTATLTLTVSDGRLFDLDLTSPNFRALLVNPVADEAYLNVLGDQEDDFPDSGVPPNPDGTYSLTISAIATDRGGNPVVPGTEIRFGSIDAPLLNNQFIIADDDGDPQEGGTGFTDVDGAFTTLGGGVGPGDTLLVFGEDLIGNRDLESARTVAAVNSASSLRVDRRFNFNDDTGTSVNNGPVLPYVIGRSVDGNITAVAFTDANGVARTRLNYPVSKLGKLAAVYAQGNGDLVAGTPELVTDVETLRFPGVSGGALVASPSSIPGNRTVVVEVCHRDALLAPIAGTLLNFQFVELGGGTGRVNGILTSGTVDEPTGADGCVDLDVNTQGMVSTGGEAMVVFSAGSSTAEVEIVTGQALLSAAPNTFTGDGGRQVQLTLTGADGVPIQGAIITGTCTVTGTGGTLNVTTQPGPTNQFGQTIAIVTATGFSPIGGMGPTGTCTFTTAGTGGPMATINWSSDDRCTLFSPQVPAGCPAANLFLSIPVGIGNAVSNPSGLNCTGPTVGACSAVFAPNTPVFITLTPNAANPTITWGGDCAGFGNAQSATIVMGLAGSTTNCSVTFTP